MATAPLKIIFAGTPDFAAQHLSYLVEQGHDVIACYSQPDRPAGRGKKLQPSAVKQVALEHNIPVLQPVNFKSAESVEELEALNADIMVVVAYGLLLPKVVLDAPKYGCINVHGSILPKWRGAAPIQRAVLSGDAETGVTIMQMDEGLDTGDMLLIETCAIEANDTSGSIYEKLANIGPQALVKALAQIADNTQQQQVQDNNLATYAKKLTKQEAAINWHLTAEEIERQIRGYQPWPVSHCTMAEQVVKVWQAQVVDERSGEMPGHIVKADKNGIQVATATNDLLITQLQPPGKKAMDATSFINGRAEWVSSGTVLPSSEQG